MKLDPLFKVENKQLFSIDGSVKYDTKAFIDIKNLSEIDSTAVNTIYRLSIPQSAIESEPEVYNEEFLANLRDQLKILEDKKVFAAINILPGTSFATAEEIGKGDLQNERTCGYVACCKHTARRIKDCTSVVGFDISECYCGATAGKAAYFVEELFPKHKHYIFFAGAAVYEDAIMAETEGTKNICQI